MKDIRVRMEENLHHDVTYWATRNGISMNEFIKESIELNIRHQNKDYDLPTSEQIRLAQLVDKIQSLEFTFAQGMDAMIVGVNGLISIAKGDNYLMDEGSDLMN